MQRWEQALNAIGSNDTEWMLGQIDWVTKQWLAEQEIARRDEHDVYAMREIRNTVDLMYHSIADACMRERIHARFPERRLVTDEEITHAMSCPPIGTRAHTRGLIISAAIARSMQYALVAFDWHQISINIGNDLLEFKMNNPLYSYEDCFKSIEEIFEKFSRL